MRAGIPKILVTGGAGFIGSAFVRLLVNRDCPRQGYNGVFKRGLSLIVVDKLTYAGDLKRLKEANGKYKFYKADISDKKRIESIFKRERPEIIVNFAAETHVDRSILDSKAFLQANIIGTHTLLDISRKYKVEKFVHISTDEVYGDIEKGKFRESSPLQPNSPYAASKAAADLFIKSYIKTYNFPAIIIRPSNNYGPWQYPEKLLPVIIYKTLKKERVPVYAKGLNVREWLYVEDCARGIFTIMLKGKIGEVYNLGGANEKRNIDVVEKILDILSKPKGLIQFVKDRPGHDYRYSLDSSKINKLGWKPKIDFEEGINATVGWYKQNLNWLEDKVQCLRGYWTKVYKK